MALHGGSLREGLRRGRVAVRGRPSATRRSYELRLEEEWFRFDRMLNHTVFFWLHEMVEANQRKAFEADLNGLREIPGIRQFQVGKPAATPHRPVIDNSYDYALMVLVDDVEAQNIYQDHEIHQAFVGKWKPHFQKLVVYDFE